MFRINATSTASAKTDYPDAVQLFTAIDFVRQQKNGSLELLSKIGFLILILVFGALAILAGVAMPEKLQQRLQGLPAVKTVLSQVQNKLAPASGKSVEQAKGSGQGKGGEQPKEAKPPPLESLLLPSPLPAKGSYGLQIGLFPDENGADELAARVNGMQLPKIAAKTLKVRGRDGKNWWLALAGEEADPGELLRTRLRLEEMLSLQSIRPVLLPAPAKP